MEYSNKTELAEEISNYIEQLWYEHNSLQSIINFLCSSEVVNKEALDYYTDKLNKKYMELELAKQKIFHEMNITPKDYKFDFYERSLLWN